MTHPTPVPQPAKGGSYVRDPVTGELALVQQTEPALPRTPPPGEPVQQSDPQPEA